MVMVVVVVVVVRMFELQMTVLWLLLPNNVLHTPDLSGTKI
jgi:hypothetical protein